MTTDTDGKSLLSRPGVGITAGIVQRSELRFSRIVVDRPALIVLRQGTKILHANGRDWTIRSGEAVALASGTFDVTNRLSERGSYEARWLLWDQEIVERFAATEGRPLIGAQALGRIDAPFVAAFDRALEAIADTAGIPDEIAAHRLAEILIWLSQRGVWFPKAESPSLATKVRRLVESSLADRWTTADVAKRLGMSEATLRRGLATEGTSFGDLLADVRMTSAMVLLQSTDQAVNRIALDVGYESASRFAIRFRERFGFPPMAIRGHTRSGAPA